MNVSPHRMTGHGRNLKEHPRTLKTRELKRSPKQVNRRLLKTPSQWQWQEHQLKVQIKVIEDQAIEITSSWCSPLFLQVKIPGICPLILQALWPREPRFDWRCCCHEHWEEMRKLRLFEASFKEDRLKSDQIDWVEMLLLWEIYHIWNQRLNRDWKVHNKHEVILWGNSPVASREDFV